MKKLLLILLFPSIAFAQAQSIEPGCYVSFETMECQEQESDFVWLDYGKEENKAIYGAPVAALITQAIEDRALLLDWIEYAQKLHAKLRKYKKRK